MDYLELARKALELRQFLEAGTYLKKITSEHQLSYGEYFELKFKVSQHLESDDYHQNLESYLVYLLKEKKFQTINLVCGEHIQSNKPMKSYIYHFKVEALMGLGLISKAAQEAKEHIEFLLSKKLYHKWEMEIENYEKYFNNFIFFKIMSLQILVIFEDLTKVENKWKEIVELIERKFSKLEDIIDLEKIELITRCYEIISQLDGSSFKSVLLNNKALLLIKKYNKSPLHSSDWKKTAELLVLERDWFTLKLCLELSLNRDEEIFLKTLALMKRKKGYSASKLTKYNKELKDKVLVKRFHETEIDKENISELDLKLEELETQVQKRSSPLVENDEEIIEIEKNLIKKLSFEEMSTESIQDLITTFIQLDFFRVVSFLIKRGEQEIQDQSVLRKIKYLKATSCLEQGDYYLALSEVNELLNSKDIILDEYVELRYLEGCLFEKVDNQRSALASFREVERTYPEYRRLQERILRIA